MSAPSNLKKTFESINRCEEVFGDIIEINKSCILDTEDNEYMIAWRNYNPHIFKGDYASQFKYIRDNQQYTYRLYDESSKSYSFVQLKYLFDNNGDIVNNSQLVYYPSIGIEKISIEDIFDNSYDESILELALSQDNKENLNYSNTSHIRIDYDSTYEKDTIHPLIHLHVGFFKSFRLSVSSFPTPFMFLSFISQHFFKKSWEKIFMDDDKFNTSLYNDELARIGILTPNSFDNENCFFLHHK